MKKSRFFSVQSCRPISVHHHHHHSSFQKETETEKKRKKKERRRRRGVVHLLSLSLSLSRNVRAFVSSVFMRVYNVSHIRTLKACFCLSSQNRKKKRGDEKNRKHGSVLGPRFAYKKKNFFHALIKSQRTEQNNSISRAWNKTLLSEAFRCLRMKSYVFSIDSKNIAPPLAQRKSSSSTTRPLR